MSSSGPEDAHPTLAGGTETREDGRFYTDVVVEKGTLVGRYLVLERLGAGGMGVVYAAYDTELDRKLALKLLHAEPGGSKSSSEGQRRLLREAQAMAKLAHPNVVTVHDVGTYGERVFVAMEFIDGATVPAWLTKQSPSWSEIVEVYVQAGQGLAAAHAAGLVHRDFKPDNVMIGRDGRVRVMDFGLARASDEASTEQDPVLDTVRELSTGASGGVSERVTRTGALVGTPAYMAPEQHLHQPADAKSDQFAFCVSLYEALYGERPFGGESVHALAFNVTQGRVREPSGANPVPTRLRTVLLRGLEVELDRRWPSMDALLAELTRGRGGRRRIALGAGLVAIGLAAGAFALRPAAESPCADVGKPLVGVWDDETRQGMKAAFDATGLAFADVSYASAARLLDSYAEDWTVSRKDACEATSVRGEQSEHMLDLRMVCLDRRLQALQATVALLSDADAQVVERATRLATDLPALAPCSDIEALLAGVEPPAPELEATVARLRGQLAEIEVQLTAGRYEEGLSSARRVEDEARELGYVPLLADASLHRGWLEEASGDRERAEQSALEAYWAARESGHDRTALEAESFLSFVVGYRLERHAEGLVWARSAEADAKRMRPDPRLRATILRNHGAVLETEGLFAEAEEKHREALALLEEELGPEHPRVARALHGLAIALLEQGKAQASIDEELRAIQIREKVLGSDHPLIGRSRLTLANAYRQLGDYQGALEQYRLANEGLEKALGPDHPEVIGSLGSLAIGYATTGEVERAVATFRDSCERARRVHGDDSVPHANCLSNLGNALGMVGESDEALQVFERSLEIRRDKLGPDHPDTGSSHSQVGEMLARLDRLDDAIEHLERGVAIKQTVLGKEHLRVAYPLIMLGEVHLLRKDYEGALATFEEVLAIREKGEVAPLDLAEAKFAVARALAALKRDGDRVDRYVEDARRVFSEGGEPTAQHLEDLEDWENGKL